LEIFTEICEFWISTKRKNRCVCSQSVRTWWRCGVRERREWQEKYFQSYVVPLFFVILCDWRGRHWILVNRIGGSGTDLRSKARVCPLDNAFYPKLVCFLGSWEREKVWGNTGIICCPEGAFWRPDLPDQDLMTRLFCVHSGWRSYEVSCAILYYDHGANVLL